MFKVNFNSPKTCAAGANEARDKKTFSPFPLPTHAQPTMETLCSHFDRSECIFLDEPAIITPSTGAFISQFISILVVKVFLYELAHIVMARKS
jgi:hypothetical protein